MLTAKQFAVETGISYPVIIEWLKEGKIPEAEQTSFKVWQIPATVAEVFKKPENRPKLGRPPKPAETFGGRLRAIAAEILEELSEQYVDFDLHSPAQDSNDWGLTYKAHSGEEKTVRVIRRASQTDDEVNDEILAQLLSKTDGPKRASKKASKKAAKKKGVREK